MIIQSLYGEYTANFSINHAYIDTMAERPYHFSVIDKKVLELYREKLAPLLTEQDYYVLESNEDNKTTAEAFAVIDRLIGMESRKNTILYAIGGGIVQDVTCFVASVLYRGIRWEYIPTTLLSQTDSCIGSKSSINYRQFKNLIGTFYPPTAIWIDLDFLHTLSQPDYLSGLGEIYKIAIMRNGLEEFQLSLPSLMLRDEEALKKEIEKTLLYKKMLIEKDEFDRCERNLLNYGHTFGHAFESVSHFAVPHGQAVSLGVMVANEISADRGLISLKRCREMRDIALKIITQEFLNERIYDQEMVLSAMRKDKKFTGGLHTCILAVDTGVKKYSDVCDDEIVCALQKCREFCL